jgi:hypothetical protein
MNSIYELLLPHLKGSFPAQRIVAATVVAEFVNHCKARHLDIRVFDFFIIVQQTTTS